MYESCNSEKSAGAEHYLWWHFQDHLFWVFSLQNQLDSNWMSSIISASFIHVCIVHNNCIFLFQNPQKYSNITSTLSLYSWWNSISDYRKKTRMRNVLIMGICCGCWVDKFLFWWCYAEGLIYYINTFHVHDNCWGVVDLYNSTTSSRII